MPSLDDSKNEFGLSKNSMDIVTEIYRRFPAVKRVIVYGSRAMGTFREGSDIDMAIVADGEFSRADLLDVADAFDDSMLPYLVDVSVLAEIKNPDLVDHINRRGKILYDRDA